jgi:heat-inducible transcriptional repressor
MLTDRQLLILQAIVNDFVQTAQAVGSRTLAKKDNILFSPATIRNEMADLEEMGFLEKTHSSSGRVPSEKGYRFYVDHLLSPSLISENEVKAIRSMFNDKIFELEKLAQQSAEILSEFTNYTSIVLGPDVVENKLKQLQLIPISADRVVAIIVTDTGHVEHRTISLEGELDSSQFEKLVNILNERLQGVPLVDLQSKIHNELREVLRSHLQDYENAYGLIKKTFDKQKGEKIFYGGKTNMLSQPEFNDVAKIRSLLSVIEQDDKIYNLIRTDKSGITVRIGQENNVEEMQHCSLITATYSFGHENVGSIAILGPTRMEYARVISLLRLFSTDLTRALSSLYQNES